MPPPQLWGFLQGGRAAWDRPPPPPPLVLLLPGRLCLPVLPLGTLGCFHGNRTMDCASKKRLNLLCVKLGWVCGAHGSHRGGARRGKEGFAGLPFPPAPPHFPEFQGPHCFGCMSEAVETGLIKKRCLEGDLINWTKVLSNSCILFGLDGSLSPEVTLRGSRCTRGQRRQWTAVCVERVPRSPCRTPVTGLNLPQSPFSSIQTGQCGLKDKYIFMNL